MPASGGAARRGWSGPAEVSGVDARPGRVRAGSSLEALTPASGPQGYAPGGLRHAPAASIRERPAFARRDGRWRITGFAKPPARSSYQGVRTAGAVRLCRSPLGRLSGASPLVSLSSACFFRCRGKGSLRPFAPSRLFVVPASAPGAGGGGGAGGFPGAPGPCPVQRVAGVWRCWGRWCCLALAPVPGGRSPGSLPGLCRFRAVAASAGPGRRRGLPAPSWPQAAAVSAGRVWVRQGGGSGLVRAVCRSRASAPCPAFRAGGFLLVVCWPRAVVVPVRRPGRWSPSPWLPVSGRWRFPRAGFRFGRGWGRFCPGGLPVPGRGGLFGPRGGRWSLLALVLAPGGGGLSGPPGGRFPSGVVRVPGVGGSGRGPRGGPCWRWCRFLAPGCCWFVIMVLFFYQKC